MGNVFTDSVMRKQREQSRARIILPELDVLCLWKDTVTPSGMSKKAALPWEMIKIFLKALFVQVFINRLVK